MIQSHSQIPRSLSVHRGTVLLGADEPHVPRRQREREREMAKSEVRGNQVGKKNEIGLAHET